MMRTEPTVISKDYTKQHLQGIQYHQLKQQQSDTENLGKSELSTYFLILGTTIDTDFGKIRFIYCEGIYQ